MHPVLEDNKKKKKKTTNMQYAHEIPKLNQLFENHSTSPIP